MSELALAQISDDLVTSDVDGYPSRNGQNAKLIGRQDPIVYASKDQDPPVARSFINAYNEQGFVVLNDVFSLGEIATFQQELERLRADPKIQQSAEVITEQNSNDLRSIFGIHENNPVFKALATDKRLADLARYLLDDDVYIHQSRLNYKPGFRGKEFYWHSDFETWHVEDGMPRMRAISMSISLTENFDCNGPLMLIPGSHRQYVVCEGETPEDHHHASLKKQEYGVPSDDCLKTLAAQGSIVSATGKPGSMIVFDCNVMHGSNGNITPFPRTNVFFVYNALSNKVVNPYCAKAPRPEHICSRDNIHPVPRS
ncbi:MAG: ectoine hydroxylase [Gammaproteobacteria bacterium]|jgi:ectoine hydroxylase